MAYLLLMLFKGAHFRFLFAISAAGIVPCGGSKKSPRTSAIVRIIFSFWSFEIGKGILKNKKLIYFLNRFKEVFCQCQFIQTFFLHPFLASKIYNNTIKIKSDIG